ncbi:MAG TPA: hypothetical protein ENK23_09260 [Sorangium sp.]|nr:hypothetical protein [Sorangium sp.]
MRLTHCDAARAALAAVRWQRLGALLAGMLLLVACGGEEPGGAAAVALGAGLSRYTPVEDGDAIELVFGSQGGWHINLAARFVGVRPDGATVTYRLWNSDGQQQLAYPIKVYIPHDGTVAMADGSFTRSGDRLVMLGAADTVVGRQVLAQLSAVVDGTLLQDERRLTIVDEVP